MHRRAGSTWATRFVLSLVALFTFFGSTPAAASPDDSTTRPPVTVSDFIPDEVNLSDCVGLVEKPGCGSEARGGAGQYLVFVALAGGLAFIIWRVTSGVRNSRSSQ